MARSPSRAECVHHVPQERITFEGSPIWILFFISIPVVDIALSMPIALLLEKLFLFDVRIPGLATVALILFIFILLSIIVFIIKYGILIIYSCSKQEAVRYGVKIGRLSVLTALLMIVMLVLIN